MGKFVDTKRVDTIDSLVDGLKDRLNNPYYVHAEDKATVSTWYNQDSKKSTLDEGAKIPYANLGSNSPIKFNKINNMLIYAMPRIDINLENGDFGLEADSIEGEVKVLPNTITPYPNDYFAIDYMERDLLFKVTSVSFDTIENGSNMYKVQFKLDQITTDHIEKQVVDTYEMIVNNIGTSFSTIIRSTDYNLVGRLENISESLAKYYKQLFFSSRVQTFILVHNCDHFYDPYLVEFLIRNKILDKDDEFLYITHQTTPPITFGIDYDKTFFRYVELKDRNKFTPKMSSQAKIIDDPLSILSTRIEDYFEIVYNGLQSAYRNTINNFDIDLYNRIRSCTKYEGIDDHKYLNILIKYFNNQDITDQDIESLEKIDYMPNIELFYNIPIIIYVLNKQVEYILQKVQDND